MTDRRDPIDDILRELVGDPIPTEEERTRSLVRFVRALDKQKGVKRSPSVRRVTVALGFAIGAVVLLVTLPRQSPAAAALREIANLVETVEPLDAPDDSYIYTEAETLVLARVPSDGLGDLSEGRDLYYSLPVRRESWIGSEGTLQLATTASDPVFFSESDRLLYYEAHLDERDRIGETEAVTVRDAFDTVWAADQTELDLQIREMLPSGSERPEHIDYLDIALQVIRESPASPATRAAALRLMADLPELEPDEGEQGVSSFQVDFEENGVLVRWSFAVDDAGFLRSEARTNLTADEVSGLAPGTITYKADYTAPIIVLSLDPRP
ncbi:MAG: hypothetical protein ACE5F5_12875 [Acidimicrobiia bacterium]